MLPASRRQFLQKHPSYRRRQRYRLRSTKLFRQYLPRRKRQLFRLLLLRVGLSSRVPRKVQRAVSAEEPPAHPPPREKLRLCRLRLSMFPRQFRPAFPTRPRSCLRSLRSPRRARRPLRPPFRRLYLPRRPRRHSTLAEPTPRKNLAAGERRLCWGSQQPLWLPRVSTPDGITSRDAPANLRIMCPPSRLLRPQR